MQHGGFHAHVGVAVAGTAVVVSVMVMSMIVMFMVVFMVVFVSVPMAAFPIMFMFMLVTQSYLTWERMPVAVLVIMSVTMSISMITA